MGRLFSSLWASILPILLVSCAGYQLGGPKPTALAEVSAIHVAMAENNTQIPRAAATVTNHVVDALIREGTYQIADGDSADAVLKVAFHTVEFDAIRTARENRLRPEEMEMTVELRWEIVSAANPLAKLDAGTSKGRTNLFVDPNLQAARQSALSDALQRASTSLAARLANGF
ncbi:MAG: LPS assembly lipoprotein LptE [Verrucomicrobiota bacterium JB023]|nr:LPS assembly lipoprotein LptE [Verrucomicrobiota bacterium JB023]